MSANIDPAVVRGFGEEWSRFDQTDLDPVDARELFEQYFSLFPWSDIGEDAEGFDLGCGSGRWARFVAPRVGRLHCADPSDALAVARRNLAAFSNVEFHHVGVEDLPFTDGSMDFGYSLGVLHHVPDTARGLTQAVRCLAPGAPFLLYLYYAFDNRPPWFRAVWRTSEAIRLVVSRLPRRVRQVVSDLLAIGIYYPLARVAAAGEALTLNVSNWPLSAYRHRSFYVMRTDALDRFGTRLEQRFTREQIRGMMAAAGLTKIRFRDDAPFWCAIGIKI